MIAPGTTLQGRYVIERAIGQGGMGAVYLARQVALNGRLVAIKQMSMPPSQGVEQQRLVAQFQQEATTLATLRHPNLIAVYDFFSEGNEYFLVMEYVPGETLDTEVQRASDPIKMPQIMAWSQELCDVLRYLHGQHPPIIFGDVKPSNIIVDTIGHVRLIDFGIAKGLQLQSATSTFIIGAGTPGYAAPEQYGTSSTDARTDIYALGATLYTLLTRKAPCDAIDRVLGRASLVPANRINPTVPSQLSAVVSQMMALRPEERYATIDEVSNALEDAGATRANGAPSPRSSETAVAVPRTTAFSRPAFWLLVLILLGVTGVFVWRDDNSVDPHVAAGGLETPLAARPARRALAVSRPTPSPSPSPRAIPTPSRLALATPSPEKPAGLPGQPSTTDIVTTGSGLMYQDIKVGDGLVPRPGDVVQVNYGGWLLNGKVIAMDLDRRTPFRFVLNAGQVIKGWDEGVSTMHVGGKRKLIIPASLAYGDSGVPPVPPGATVVLDVELLMVEPQPSAAVTDSAH